LASTGQFQISCNGSIGVEIHRSGLAGLFRSSIEAACVRIDCARMQVETTAQFKVGDKLVLDLQALDLRLEELRGKVTNAIAKKSPTSASTEARQGQMHFYDIDIDRGNSRLDTQHCLRQLQNLHEQQSR